MAYLYMLKQLWRYAGAERWKVVVYFVMHAISVAGEVGKPCAFALVINALQANGPHLLADVKHGLLAYVLFTLTFEVMHRPARYLEIGVAFRCRQRFVDAMYQRLQALPLSWHTEHHSGSIINRVNVAGTALHEFGFDQMNYVAVFVKFWGPLIILWRMSPQISVAAFGVGTLMVLIARLCYNRTVPYCRAANDALHMFAAAFFDYMSNMRTIITLRLGGYVKQDLEARLARAYPFIAAENNVTQVKCLSMALLILLLEAGVIFYYIWMKKQAGAAIMIGSVTAIFQYLGQLMESFGFYAGDYERAIHGQVDFQAIHPVLEARPSLAAEGPDLGDWRRIAVHPLCYSHGNDKQHLDNVSLGLTRPGRIALVGESGAGKSTLLQVLRGLSQVAGGLVTVDGEALPLSSLAGAATLIPQEPEIFENTLRHNITMGIPATEEEVRQAMWVACFDRVAAGLPQGLESDIREKGVNLSGGEKQRLALARGVFALRDSSLVLLDEPTSNVDPRTEMLIFTRLLDLLRDRAVVASLHRLHLLRLFDYVYVMKEGRVVEEGTFGELCRGEGEFARLWARYQVEAETDDAHSTPFGRSG